jgi:hypothetical protein
VAREEKGLEGGKELGKERDWRREGAAEGKGLEKRGAREGKVLRARSSAWGSFGYLGSLQLPRNVELAHNSEAERTRVDIARSRTLQRGGYSM